MHQPGKLDKPKPSDLTDMTDLTIERLNLATRLNSGEHASPETQRAYDDAYLEADLAQYAFIIFDDDDFPLSKEREKMRTDARNEVTEMRRKATILTQRRDEVSIALGLLIHANINEYEAHYARFLECHLLAVSSSNDQIISDTTRYLATQYAAGALLAMENILAKNRHIYNEAGE